jgi:hypothetical protein
MRDMLSGMFFVFTTSAPIEGIVFESTAHGVLREAHKQKKDISIQMSFFLSFIH